MYKHFVTSENLYVRTSDSLLYIIHSISFRVLSRYVGSMRL